MMGVTDAQGLIAIVDARVDGERPRPEIQPVGKCQGRQRQVRAVSTWRDPHIRRGKGGITR